MDDTIKSDEIPDNVLPDILEVAEIPEPSLITPNGLKYYAENDVVSWLKGFNVLVLKLDEIITEQNERLNNLENK